MSKVKIVRVKTGETVIGSVIGTANRIDEKPGEEGDDDSLKKLANRREGRGTFSHSVLKPSGHLN